MISNFLHWCGRNIEHIIGINVALLFASALDQLTLGNIYPLGLCVILVAVIWILQE